MDEQQLRLEAMKAAIDLVCCLQRSGVTSPGELGNRLGVEGEGLNIMDIVEQIFDRIIGKLV